ADGGRGGRHRPRGHAAHRAAVDPRRDPVSADAAGVGEEARTRMSRPNPDPPAVDPVRANLLRDWLRGYKLFVAWRYLMVSNFKVSSRALRMAAGGLAALVVAAAARALHLEPDLGLAYDPLGVAQLAAAVFVAAVMFIGVLRYSKPSLILGVL